MLPNIIQSILIQLSFSLSFGFAIESCGDFTTRDIEGPFFVPNADKVYQMAPMEEIEDPEQAAILQGRIFDSNCIGIPDALVEVWYAGYDTLDYTFPPEELWYRGAQMTDQDGSYQFIATFPGKYLIRPINHYHFKVTTGGMEFITQAYFKDKVPMGYRRYVSGRQSQFAKISGLAAQKEGPLPNGGRR